MGCLWRWTGVRIARLFAAMGAMVYVMDMSGDKRL
jgi:hypothetical protein